MFWGDDPRRRDRLLADLFFAISAREWDRREQHEEHLAPFLSGLERCHTPRAALDLGTGGGATAAEIARRYPQARVVGVDGSARMVRTAAATHQLDNLEFQRARFEALPFAKDEFDLITMHNALPELDELVRVAAPGAEVLIANSYFGPPGERWLKRWDSVGLVREASEPCGQGSWQLFALAGGV